MEHAHQLAELVGLIAVVRTQGRTARLALHNTDRFGLLHLYFERGRLIRVEGHAEGAAASLQDLETWRQGAVRLQTMPPGTVEPGTTPPLDGLLDRTLAQLERAGVVHPAPLAVRRGESAPRVSAVIGDTFGPGVAGLPPLTPRAPVTVASSAGGLSLTRDDHVGDLNDALTDPQWQLLALAVRQITDHVGHLLGAQASEALLREALVQASGESAFLRGLVVDASGWLRLRDVGVRASCSPFEAAQAMAQLLAILEALYALRLGAPRVQQLIAAAVAPLRMSLEQVGLSVVAH